MQCSGQIRPLKLEADRVASGVLSPQDERPPSPISLAFALKRVKGGYKVSHALDYALSGQADIASLRLLVEHGDAGSITLDRELANDEVLGAAALKR